MIDAVNTQFSRFVSFAQERVGAGKEKAIATKGDVMAHGGTTLEERKITVTDKIDWVSLSIFRGGGAKRANNEVREMFRKAVADLFGGENNIPDKVKEAVVRSRRLTAAARIVYNMPRETDCDRQLRLRAAYCRRLCLRR